MVLMLVPVASHNEKSYVSHFDHLGVTNAMLSLMTLLASCDTDTSYFTLPLSIFIDPLLIWGRMPHIGLLNSIMAGIRSPSPTGAGCVYNKTKLMSCLVSMHFLKVHLTN